MLEWKFNNWTKSINWSLWKANEFMINASQIDTVIDPLLSKSVLRITYPKGSLPWVAWAFIIWKGQFISLPKFLSNDDNAYIRLEYQVMFDNLFNWVNGGKLPELYTVEMESEQA